MPTMVSRARVAACCSDWRGTEDTASWLLDMLLIERLLNRSRSTVYFFVGGSHQRRRDTALLLRWRGKEMLWRLHSLLYPGEFLPKAPLAEGEHGLHRFSGWRIAWPGAQAGQVGNAMRQHLLARPQNLQ